MKVAYLVPESRISGGQRVVFQQAVELARRGIEVTVVAASAEPDWFDLRGVAWERADFARSRALAEADAGIATFWTTVRPAVERVTGAVFHLCQGYEADFSFYASQRDEIRAAYALPTRKLAIAPHLARRLREEGYGDAVLIGQAFSASDFPFRRERSFSEADVSVLLVGLYEADVKGIREALEGLRILRDRGARFRVRRIATEPMSPPEASLGMTETYGTNRTAAQMRRSYHGADLLVGPSHPEEGFGLPVLEALSTGLPVALSDTAGHRYIARDAAAYFACGSAPAIAERVGWLLERPAERARLSRAGPDEAKRFTTGAVVDRLLSEIRAALEQSGRRAEG